MLIMILRCDDVDVDNDICNDPPRRYDITILNRENFNFKLKTPSILLMKNESKFFTIYIHQTMHHYLNKYTHTHTYRYSNSVHIIHIMESKLVHTYN